MKYGLKICILCLDIIKYHNSETLVSDGFVDLLTFARTTPENSQNMNQTKFKMMMVSFLLINNYEGKNGVRKNDWTLRQYVNVM